MEICKQSHHQMNKILSGILADPQSDYTTCWSSQRFMTKVNAHQSCMILEQFHPAPFYARDAFVRYLIEDVYQVLVEISLVRITQLVLPWTGNPHLAICSPVFVVLCSFATLPTNNNQALGHEIVSQCDKCLRSSRIECEGLQEIHVVWGFLQVCFAV